MTRQETIGYRLMTGLSVPDMTWLEAEQAVAAARLHAFYNHISADDIRQAANHERARAVVEAIQNIFADHGTPLGST